MASSVAPPRVTLIWPSISCSSAPSLCGHLGDALASCRVVRSSDRELTSAVGIVDVVYRAIARSTLRDSNEIWLSFRPSAPRNAVSVCPPGTLREGTIATCALASAGFVPSPFVLTASCVAG